MTQAPSPKEALELKPCPFCGSEITHIESIARSFDPPRVYHEWHHKNDVNDCPIRFRGKIVCASSDGLQATKKYRDAWNTRATLQPSGERREAIAETMWRAELRRVTGKERNIAWSEVAPYDQERFRYVADTILSSGLVQDEAAIRADEREKCAKICDQIRNNAERRAGIHENGEARNAALDKMEGAIQCAAAIRSARDGGEG